MTDSPAKYRNYPHHTLKEAVAVADKIRENRAGKPMRRLLLADALTIKPGSSNFRDILSSSIKYGLTTGSEKAPEIALTELGKQATSPQPGARRKALRQAAMEPKLFGEFYRAYDDAKLPSEDMLTKILVSEYNVPEAYAQECAQMIAENGRMVGIIQNISNSPHVVLTVDDDQDDEAAQGEVEWESEDELESERAGDESVQPASTSPDSAGKAPAAPTRAKPIFVGHGKNRTPLGKLQKILDQFKIPYKVAVAEPNLGRPIPDKVRDTILECGSAILIFTKDEKFLTDDGQAVWRPSENVVHELGATYFQYNNRVVIFKEKGLTLPTNYASVGYIEFDGAEEPIEAKTADLLHELIGFGLVTITPAS